MDKRVLFPGMPTLGKEKEMFRILLVEDDKDIIENLSAVLRAEGFQVRAEEGQKEALEALEEEGFDLLLLDVSLKNGNGFSLCSAVKAAFDLPVIFLTASGDEFSVVTGLELGAEDYVSKPFRPRELISRIRSVLRRCGKSQAVLEIEDLRVDTVRATVTKKGQDCFLTALEYRLLLFFLNHKGMVLSRGKLLEEIWDAAGEFVNDNTLTVYIKRLREKIETDPQNPTIIRTVRGLGYKLGE